MTSCGFWAHCAHHCDLPCEHNKWCAGFPVRRTRRLSALLRRLADRLEN